MSLRTQLTEDMKTAMCAEDRISLNAIRPINAAIKQLKVDERTRVNDAKVIPIPTKMVKQRKDSVKIYTETGYQDSADKENAETEIPNRYLPQMIPAEETRTAVEAAAAETSVSGMADMGKVMGVLETRLAGKADMDEVNRALKAALAA